MITARCPVSEEQAEAIEALLCETAISPWTLFRARPEDSLELVGYGETQPELETAYADLRAGVAGLPKELRFAEMPDTDWKEAYKNHLKAWQSGRLKWIPRWERNQAEIRSNEAAVFLDSGMAFGTGSHETTQLCAQRLVDFTEERGPSFTRCSVIDAGTGSGILALSAAILGAHAVFAFDNDPDAIAVARDNASDNALERGRIEWAVGGVHEALMPVGGRNADLLLANIHTAVLVKVPVELVSAVAPGGWLVLSGILAKESEAISRAYLPVVEDIWGEARPFWDSRRQGDWVDFCFRRPVDRA
jgi:ribosomal protein L11 methyltransferase